MGKIAKLVMHNKERVNGGTNYDSWATLGTKASNNIFLLSTLIN